MSIMSSVFIPNVITLNVVAPYGEKATTNLDIRVLDHVEEGEEQNRTVAKVMKLSWGMMGIIKAIFWLQDSSTVACIVDRLRS